MRVVLAPDSFKGAMTAVEAAHTMAQGARDAAADVECVEVPMSDGGEGFVDSIAAALGIPLTPVRAHDHLGRPVTAPIAVREGVAYLDVASVVGLGLVPEGRRDVLRSSTRGVGELIRAALRAGAAHIVVGLGGSGTNDGGAGMLAALGMRFLDGGGREVDPVPAGALEVAAVDRSGLDPRLAGVRFTIASDVTNPLCGPQGASRVFGPQKGADDRAVADLDRALLHLAQLIEGVDDPPAAALPGAGAAGGLGYAFLACLGARSRPGVQVVAEAVDLPGRMDGVDLVLAGEGRVDAQTLHGKTPMGVAAVAASRGIPVIVVAGRVTDDAEVLLSHGVTALVQTGRDAAPIEVLLGRARRDLRTATATAVRIFAAGRRSAGR